jgi:hypothetical protein
MAGIDWELRLVNEVSAAAKQMNIDMRSLSETLKQVQAGLKNVEGAEHKETGAAKEAKEGHKSFFGDMLSAELVADGIEMVAEKVADLGLEFVKSTIEATDFEYKTSVALTHMTGSAEQAKEIMEQARAFANGVGEDVDKVTETFERFAATGLRGDALTAATAAAKDLAAVSGQSFDATSELFEMIGSDRGLGGRAVMQLTRFPGLLKELEKHFGVLNSKNPVAKLTKDLDAVPLKGAEGLKLLENMVLKTAHEGALGDVGVELGNSIEGGIVKIKNDWKEMLGDLATNPAFEDLRRVISEIGNYFDPATESGKRAEKAFADAIEPILQGVDEILAHPDAIKDFFSSSIDDIKVVGEVAKDLVEAVKSLSVFAHPFAQSKKSKFEQQAEYDEEETAKAERLHKSLGIPVAFSDWLSGNQHSNEGLGVDASAIPSNEGLGVDASAIPSKADGGTVTSTGLVTVHEGEEIVPAGVSQGGGSSTSISNGGNEFHFHVSVPGGGGEHLDEQLLATKLAELAPSAIMSALEQMNQMRGGR